MENIEFENRDICRECGGYCCKKCGCDYSPDDFENLKIDYLQSLLEKGNISIVSYQKFKQINGMIINEPFLYLRARNKNRPIVDLLSMKTTCASLQEDGCKFSLQERPKGGVNLIPASGDTPCYPLENPLDIVNGWKNHQKTLMNLVKRLTGKSTNRQLEEDVYRLFLDVIEGNFDGVYEAEIQDVLGMLPLLKDAYKTMYEKAVYDTSKKASPQIVKRLTLNKRK